MKLCMHFSENYIFTVHYTEHCAQFAGTSKNYHG